ncbi:MAG: PD-(D/E)XK nuclease family transposase [Deltaproteobacteria bacterium]|nr:PD-(D/E)XK nuclease family transposase [Deltaproteobacteria bacterium]MBN2673008.1 PD-(D/E)XK nuclease family transposase [Deltaproteobacteria bacterium]
MKRISPINDFFFRYLFGKAGHETVTLDFINAVLKNKGMGPLSKVIIKNPFNFKDSVTDKESILDIKAEDENQHQYNIEMQLSGNRLFTNRALYYWAKGYTSQIGEGDDYKELCPVISINVLDFLLFEIPQIHSCFLIKEKAPEERVLTDHLMMHFIDLTTFRSMNTIKTESTLEAWLTWFCFDGENMKGLETILERNPAVSEANKLYTQFTADSALMEKYEARQKYLRDVSAIKNVSHDEGYAQGKADGITVGMEAEKHAVARTMKSNGEPTKKILQYTGLSKEEIERL